VAGFLKVLRFPLSIIIPPITLQSPYPIIWGWHNRPVAAAVPKSHHTNKKKRCHERKILDLTDTSGSENSGKATLIAQFKERFHISGGTKLKLTNFYSTSKEEGN
jgi:hypothetical protein